MELIKGNCFVCSSNGKILSKVGSYLIVDLLQENCLSNVQIKEKQVDNLNIGSGICAVCACKVKKLCKLVTDYTITTKLKRLSRNCFFCRKHDDILIKFSSYNINPNNTATKILKLLNIGGNTIRNCNICVNCHFSLSVFSDVSEFLSKLNAKDNEKQNGIKVVDSSSVETTNSNIKRQLSVDDINTTDENVPSAPKKKKQETEDPTKKEISLRSNNRANVKMKAKEVARIRRSRSQNKLNEKLRKELDSKLKHLRTVNMETENVDMNLSFNVITDQKMLFDIPYVSLDYNDCKLVSEEVISISSLEEESEEPKSAKTETVGKSKKIRSVSELSKQITKNKDTESKVLKPLIVNSIKSKAAIKIQLRAPKHKKSKNVQNKISKSLNCNNCNKYFSASYELKKHQLEHSTSYSPSVLVKNVDLIELKSLLQNKDQNEDNSDFSNTENICKDSVSNISDQNENINVKSLIDCIANYDSSEEETKETEPMETEVQTIIENNDKEESSSESEKEDELEGKQSQDVDSENTNMTEEKDDETSEEKSDEMEDLTLEEHEQNVNEQESIIKDSENETMENEDSEDDKTEKGKPVEKKVEDEKSEDEKSEDKKSEDEKSEDKKSEDENSEDEKSDDEKLDAKNDESNNEDINSIPNSNNSIVLELNDEYEVPDRNESVEIETASIEMNEDGDEITTQEDTTLDTTERTEDETNNEENTTLEDSFDSMKDNLSGELHLSECDLTEELNFRNESNENVVIVNRDEPINEVLIPADDSFERLKENTVELQDTPPKQVNGNLDEYSKDTDKEKYDSVEHLLKDLAA